MKKEWVKIKNLSVGARIAVCDSGDLKWEEIVSIKKVGREQVYDIEVENSHNFVGNGILAHNTYIFGNVAIGDAGGIEGIGTTSPHKLDVAGEVGATAFVNLSTEEAKENISYLNETQYDEALEGILGARVAAYDYKDEECLNASSPQMRGGREGGELNYSNTSPSPSSAEEGRNSCSRRLGLIAEEAPPEVLSADGKGVDLYKMVSFAWAGMKAQQTQIEKLKMDMEEIRSQITNYQLPIVSSESGFSFASIINGFKGLGAVFENNWFKAKNIAGEMFHIRKNAVPEENSIGETIIPTGQTFVIVQNKFVKSASQIFLTPKVPLKQSLAITEIKEGESFKVELAEAETKDIRFAWLIIGTLEPELDAENSNDPASAEATAGGQIQMSNQIQNPNDQESENPNVQSSNDQINVTNEQQETPAVEAETAQAEEQIVAPVEPAAEPSVETTQ